MRQTRAFNSRNGFRSITGERVLVTGGAGFIGANLVRVLLDQDCQVTVLDNLSSGQPGYLAGLPIDFVEGDIRDVDRVNQLVQSCDNIVHLAAQADVQDSIADPRLDCEVNITGTLNLLEACRRAASRGPAKRIRTRSPSVNGGPRFVFASSCAPLGRQPPPTTENQAPLPISPYGVSKLAGESYCLAYHGAWGLRTVALRLANVYGPFSYHKDSVIARFFKDALASGTIVIDGDGRQTRDFVYVDDVCQAIVRALTSEVSGEVIQIGAGVETDLLTLASWVQAARGGMIRIEHSPPRPGDIRNNFSAIRKANRMLEWRPRTTLADGLQRTWRWFCRVRVHGDVVTV